MVSAIKPNTNQRIAIRADASIDIGSGHIMRCVTLAKEMQKRGKEIFFICRELSENLSRSISDNGFHLERLSNYRAADVKIDSDESSAINSSVLDQETHPDWIGTIAALKHIRPYLLVIDHFGIDAKWENAIRRIIPLRIAVIDGQRNRKHDCDILIDPNYSLEGKDGWKSLVLPECELFVGPQFAFLRPEFHKERKNIKVRYGRVEDILICFGGSDKFNATKMVLQALKEINHSIQKVHVVIGSQNPWKDNLISICSNFKNFVCHIDPENIAALMSKADLAIGSGGIMTWERCFLGVPSILMSIAENEVRNCQALSNANAVIYIGRREHNNVESIKNAILGAVADPELLQSLSRRSIEIMSGSKTSCSDQLYESLS